MDNFQEIKFEAVLAAQKRIQDFINITPIISNQALNLEFGNQIFFKLENKQVTSSFKARGVYNFLLAYKEKYGYFPKKISAQSSGNHAYAIAHACKKFKIPAIIFMANNTNLVKIELARSLGAEVVLCAKRSQANMLAQEKEKEGYVFMHPSDNDDIIAGQGTLIKESLDDIGNINKIFLPCGGGGLASSAQIVSSVYSPKTKIIACEPRTANDASQSIRNNQIFKFEDSPNTIADGARTLAISERCFHYLKQIESIIEVDEQQINFWQEYLSKILSEKIEPTSALAFGGLVKYLEENTNILDQKFLVVITGGNI